MNRSIQLYPSLHLIALCFVLLSACGEQGHKSPNQSKLSPQDVQRIVLVGGTLISGMEQHAFFECAMLQHFAGADISFRNIGWAADDVYGLARSQFGSAQNTMSWQPPSAEEGFGSQVLKEHIEEAIPTTLIIGYGSEVAFAEDEEDFTLFTSGYRRLLDEVDKGIKVVLLTPTMLEAARVDSSTTASRNEWLQRASEFIKNEAAERDLICIDLYSQLVTDPSQQKYTRNGISLNIQGYQKMANILLDGLGIAPAHGFEIAIDENGDLTKAVHCQATEWQKTVNGVSFYLSPDPMHYYGNINTNSPVAVFINGRLASRVQDTISPVSIYEDSLVQARLLATVKEKNRLYRYRLRPLNEAYIYLFRRHEMGHLAYEMDELKALVQEKEEEINHLISSGKHLVEVEFIRPWQPPRNYPEDEVPAFVPEPNIEEELKAFHLSPYLEVNLFAADPMIANPINVNWDTKGRAWVATSSTYPHIVPGREPNDKIIILEDTDHDGQADKHTVFAENLLVPHSVMPVPGGAYVTATTELLFLADHDGDDIADERTVVYDGFGNADVHHMIHGLRWMPWGDLHFTQSIYINTFVETPFGPRILNGSGTWSFRPETERLEVFNRGLINPWGEALDQWGQSFATDGAGSSGINYIFPESAHPTAVGAPRVLQGLNNNTPKNTGAEIIYSQHFPSPWQGSAITSDFRANRTVRYELSPHLSGYESKEVETIIRSDHRSYRPVDNKIGPDGALYIVDWYNPIIDHGEVDFHHPIRDRKHGRVWRVTNKGTPLLTPTDFTQLSESELLDMLKAPEQYIRMQANRAYVERKGSIQQVVQWTKSQSQPQSRLEGLWLLAALNHYDEPLLVRSLKSGTYQERAAAVRLLSHYKDQQYHLPILQNLINDSHPQVRLEAIHALRNDGTRGAAELVIQALNSPTDENIDFALELTLRHLKSSWLPAMVSGKEVFEGNPQNQLFALLSIEDTTSRNLVAHLVETPGIDTTLRERAWVLMAKIGDAKIRETIIEKALTENDPKLLRTMAAAPKEYNAKPGNEQLIERILRHDSLKMRQQGLRLAGRWKLTSTSNTVREIINEADELSEKINGFRALWQLGFEDEVISAAKSANTITGRTAATNIWISEDATAAAPNSVELLSNIDSLDQARSLFAAFRRTEVGPDALISALQGKKISREVANAGLQMAQSSGLNLVVLEEALRKAGNIEPLGNEMSRDEKDAIITTALEMKNVGRGRQLYRRQELLCATCHRINGIGGLIGPDLTTVGSYMTPNSLLESLLNPNSDIKQNYETALITKNNGEIVSGRLERKTNNSTLLRQTNNEILEIPESEIDKVDVSPASLMPAGLTRNLSREELTDLLSYLISLGGSE